ncbi:MAG: VCBS repeat-containing protein [Pseudorhodobacter sp.]|nr:VCBS repeat-containing protein [Pseudorhodobacter sp.]
MRLLLAALALLGASVAAQAQETWALPDGKAYIATSEPAPEVRPEGHPVWPISARLSEPTDRYSHDVLGGIPRWGALSVTALACADCRNGYTGGGLRLPEDLVFEDTGARLWDVTGDGIPEIVVVESHVQKGARLTAYHLRDGKLRRLASTGFIGQANRWLAPLGVGDFNGDGRPDIAYVDRPHLARQVVIVTQQGNRLVEVARVAGFTNHRIGQPFISGGVRDCGAGGEAIVATADWSQLVALRLDQGKAEARSLGAFRGPADFTRALHC